MEIEKTLTVSAPRELVWALLLDPQVMAGAVPGMKSIEVVSPTEYVAVMHQKISFISAKFKLRTHIVEQRAPEYLRAEGTGEDASVASSLKQRSEIFLTPAANGGTELRTKVNVDLLGRLGTFGLSVMKTKADRLWEEFGANLKARIEGGDVPTATVATAASPSSMDTVVASTAAPVAPTPVLATGESPASESGTARAAATLPPAANPAVAPAPAPLGVSAEAPEERDRNGWLSRLLGFGRPARTNLDAKPSGRSIRIEVRQLDRTITVEWPVEAAEQCRDWLRELTNHPQ
ncbi:MAG: SRPBCC family protein [Proteobacteria bacterium]|nr:SRPBCC family protein [Pseudomonadota bacterium]